MPPLTTARYPRDARRCPRIAQKSGPRTPRRPPRPPRSSRPGPTVPTGSTAGHPPGRPTVRVVSHSTTTAALPTRAAQQQPPPSAPHSITTRRPASWASAETTKKPPTSRPSAKCSGPGGGMDAGGRGAADDGDREPRALGAGARRRRRVGQRRVGTRVGTGPPVAQLAVGTAAASPRLASRASWRRRRRPDAVRARPGRVVRPRAAPRARADRRRQGPVHRVASSGSSPAGASVTLASASSGPGEDMTGSMTAAPPPARGRNRRGRRHRSGQAVRLRTAPRPGRDGRPARGGRRCRPRRRARAGAGAPGCAPPPRYAAPGPAAARTRP